MSSALPSNSRMDFTMRSDRIDPDAFRQAIGRYASGITVIAGHHGTEPLGFTCQSFYSVSLEPPMVSFSVMRTSTTYPRIRDTGTFSVNVLSHAQDAISDQFAKRGADKWAGIKWTPTINGNPAILGTLAWLDCIIEAEYDGGDHVIVLGRVNQMSPCDWNEGGPLLFFMGQYRHLNLS